MTAHPFAKHSGGWLAAICVLALAACSSRPGGPGAPGHVLQDYPVLEQKFHQANQSLKAGQHRQALQLYTEISKQLADTTHADMLSLLFAGTVELRRSACLVELDRPQEAKAILESPAMHRYRKTFDSATTYDYCLVYGNLLGSQKQISAMDAIFKKGLAVAAEELGDPEKCQEIWNASLKWGRLARDWKFLDVQSRRAMEFGKQNEDILVQHAASEAQCFADAGLGRKAKARKEIQQVIQRMKKLHEPAGKIDEFNRLLNSISGK